MAVDMILNSTLTIGIITLNETDNIKRCIDSAFFANQIIVMDSGSDDNTVFLAQQLGARVYSETNWQGFAEQRNRLLKHCNTDYIFFLDADEVISSDLKNEIQDAVKLNTIQIWETSWLEVAFGRTLHRVRSKKTLPRLFKTSSITGFKGTVHESAVLIDPTLKRKYFKTPLLHYSRVTIHDSLKKLTQYSMLGASKRLSNKKKGGVLRGLLSSIWMFVKLYFFRFAFLEGGPGFLYSLFISLEFFFRQAALYYDRDSLHECIKR